MLKNEEFIQDFIDEAGSHVEQIESYLLELASNLNDQELVNQLFRSVHSIKGTAGFFGLDNIVRLSHSMESLFGAVRSEEVHLDDLSIDALLEANDCLGTMVKDPSNSQNIDISDYIHTLDAFFTEGSIEAMPQPAEHNPEPAIIDQDSPAPHQDDNRDHKVNHPTNAPAVSLEDSIRVSIGLLNDLMNLTSELVLGRNQLLRGLESHRKQVEGLEPILQNIDSITTQLQERVMQTRMQPLGNVFNKFPRIIRDLSRQLGKEIRLEMEGTQVELDKSIIEALADPLTHLIRNAADHGIEKPRDRENAGKSREGTIKLSAFQEGGYVSILVADDGAGIDVELLKSRILQKGLKTQEELSLMEEKEILGQIMQPGFSTASSVTDLSGRGVGMDVVRTNIEKMGGSIEIDSQAGGGTTFKLNLPMTLAIISSLIVESGGHNFALPQVNLQEMIRVKAGDRDRSIELLNGYPVLRFRNRLLPILSLSRVLGLSQDSSWESLVNHREVIRILVLKIGERRFGLIVDAIRDDEEILVKPLPRHLKDLRCYSGVTILGDGKIAMILDAEGLAAQGELKFPETDKDSEIRQDTKMAAAGEKTMLLFSCSGTETLGLELSLVSRVEEIRPDDIELVGDKEYIEFRGRNLRLIRPEEYLPISRREYERQKLYVIVPKLTGQPMGLLIGRIHDTVALPSDFNEQDIKAHGIMGTTFWNRKIVLALNLGELLQKAAPEEYGEGSLMEAKAGKEGRY
ncbi:MAG: chemotaxis protein CheA [Clostridiales bacterium]|nr:chemotaxis protein CheA [Clostridiales bacterium]